MKRCIVGIRRTDMPVNAVGKYVPTVWFPSMATMAAVLSEDNRAMLRLMPNLSRTLRMMEGYGLVSIEKNARETQPVALATEFLVVLDSPQGDEE